MDVRDKARSRSAGPVLGQLLLLVHDEGGIWRHVDGSREADRSFNLAGRGLVR